MSEKTVNSPLPGIFYRSPGADEPPYATEGATVSAGDVLGVIEVMKSYYDVTAEERGTVQRFLVESGDAVDIGQPLVVLDD